MFFVTTHPVPFKTINDAIQAYPQWNFMFMNGIKILIHNMAEQGDPDFITLWKRYETNPSEIIYDSVDHGFKLIEEGNNVIYGEQNMLLGHLKSNPTKQDIQMIQTGKHELHYLILGKSSPLLPMFIQGSTYLRENGLERKIFLKWFGEFHAVIDSDENTLTLGQMVLVFAMMMVVFIITLLLLCGEITFKYFISRNANTYRGGNNGRYVVW